MTTRTLETTDIMLDNEVVAVHTQHYEEINLNFFQVQFAWEGVGIQLRPGLQPPTPISNDARGGENSALSV